MVIWKVLSQGGGLSIFMPCLEAVLSFARFSLLLAMSNAKNRFLLFSFPVVPDLPAVEHVLENRIEG